MIDLKSMWPSITGSNTFTMLSLSIGLNMNYNKIL